MFVITKVGAQDAFEGNDRMRGSLESRIDHREEAHDWLWRSLGLITEFYVNDDM